jgi:hypothetical protein
MIVDPLLGHQLAGDDGLGVKVSCAGPTAED